MSAIRCKDRITILVNSCDTYNDLWYPFFKLLKKYWNVDNIRIILNTESLDYSFDGLNIECVHPKIKKSRYGARIINAINKIDTEYTILLLDDFFIRTPVNNNKIDEIISYMDNDKSIAYFNCDVTPTYCDLEVDKYNGYKRIPNGNRYILNMQAAVWRTKILKRFWVPNVSPWDWEERCNLMASTCKKYKFYCAKNIESGFCYYGRGAFGIVRGRWGKNDVVPLFEKEGIQMDFSKRGFFEDIKKEEIKVINEKKSVLKTIVSQMRIMGRCLPKYRYRFVVYILKNIINGEHRFSVDAFIEEKQQKIKESTLK